MNNEGQIGNCEVQVGISEVVVKEKESAEDQLEVFTLSSKISSKQAKEDGLQGERSSVEGAAVITEVVTIPMSTLSLEAYALSALRALASQTDNMTTSEAMAHIEDVLQIPHHITAQAVMDMELMIEDAHEVIAVAVPAVQNTTPAIESMIEDEQSNNSSEKMVDVMKTKSAVPKIHQCPECKKVYSHRFSLSRHLKLHTSGIKCTECSKMFLSSSKLATHIKTHHTPKKVKDIVCPECGEEFYCPSKLRVHLCSHTGERPFPCSFCDKKFLCTSHRKRHEHLHTGEHPFVCKTCGKGFITSFNLKTHTYTHTKENPYPCSICGKRFSQWGSMMRHISAIHKKRKDAKCPHCKEFFARMDYLKFHIRKCHWHKCPTCKTTFEFEVAFEQHKTECTGPVIIPNSTVKGSAKTKLPSFVSGCLETCIKSPLLTPIQNKVRKSPLMVSPVSQRKRSDPLHIDQLMSIYQQFEGDSLTDPNYQAEEQGEGEEEIMEMPDEVELELKEVEGMDENVEGDEDGLDQMEMLDEVELELKELGEVDEIVDEEEVVLDLNE